MALAEKLQQKLEKKREALAEKSKAAEKSGAAQIDSGEWLLLFLAAGFVQIVLILINIIGLIPIIGQASYPVLVAVVNIPVTGAFFLYLSQKGLTHYWTLAFGGGIANLVPILNWFGWLGCALILYFLVKAEKIPLAGEAIEKAAKAASKVPIK